MKLLLDSCVWGGARRELTAAGHDVVAAADWPKIPAMKKSSEGPIRGSESW